ncbi:odorant receptor 47a-like [Chelonus insularis]|uniref:odorant receptor 47a-like n=1 Tax=Chelonus insularis TaxID=460826 RepID=UPI00158C0BD0|nr:odorant receptor 47a-like [Chelonus insularis]
MLFNQMIQVMIASLINVSTDLMFISIVSHLCGQIEILIRNMNELGMSILLNFESGDTVNLVKCLMIVGFMLMQSYLYTYPADNLANLGEKMLRGLYSSYWYEMPNRLTKNLVFMMMRLNIPPYLTAGKFFYLTRISYTSVVKTGASYLSVLRIFLQRN